MDRMRHEKILVIICENDCGDPLRSRGAIVMEQYTNIDPETAMGRAKSLSDGGTYGRVWVAELGELKEVPRKRTIEIIDSPGLE